MEEANKLVQAALDEARTMVMGIDLSQAESFSEFPELLTDPQIVQETTELPTKAKGVGHRRVNNFLTKCVYIGKWEQITRAIIDTSPNESTPSNTVNSA